MIILLTYLIILSQKIEGENICDIQPNYVQEEEFHIDVLECYSIFDEQYFEEKTDDSDIKTLNMSKIFNVKYFVVEDNIEIEICSYSNKKFFQKPSYYASYVTLCDAHTITLAFLTFYEWNQKIITILVNQMHQFFLKPVLIDFNTALSKHPKDLKNVEFTVKEDNYISLTLEKKEDVIKTYYCLRSKATCNSVGIKKDLMYIFILETMIGYADGQVYFRSINFWIVGVVIGVEIKSRKRSRVEFYKPMKLKSLFENFTCTNSELSWNMKIYTFSFGVHLVKEDGVSVHMGQCNHEKKNCLTLLPEQISALTYNSLTFNREKLSELRIIFTLNIPEPNNVDEIDNTFFYLDVNMDCKKETKTYSPSLKKSSSTKATTHAPIKDKKTFILILLGCLLPFIFAFIIGLLLYFWKKYSNREPCLQKISERKLE